MLSSDQSAKQERGLVLWFTGLSGAGKTSISRALAQALKHQGTACTILDGDEVRRRLSRDLGFSPL